MDNEDVMLWCDGTWCYRSELEEMAHMSDDYTVVPFGSDEHWRITQYLDHA